MPTPILHLQHQNLDLQLPTALCAASVTTRQMMPLPVLMADVNGDGEMTILVTIEDRYAQLAHLMLGTYQQRVARRDNHTTTQLLAETIDGLIRTAAQKPMIEVCIDSAVSQTLQEAADTALKDITARIREIALARSATQQTADEGH